MAQALTTASLRAVGIPEAAITEAVAAYRAENFQEDLDQSFGDDLGDALDQARRRAESEGDTGA